MHRLRIDEQWQRMTRGGAAAVAEELAPQANLPLAAQTLLGISQLDSGRASEAIATFDKVLAQNPANAVARLHRGLAHFLAGNKARAAEDLGAKPFFPNPEFLKRFLRIFWPLRLKYPELLTAGEDRTADVPLQELYDKAKAGSSPKPAARKIWSAGVKEFIGGNHRVSCELLERAVTLDSSVPEYKVNLAWCTLHLGQHQEARTILAPLIEEALENYRTHRKRDLLPHAVIITEWSWCLLDGGEAREAAAMLSTIRPEGPDDYMMHILLALCWTMLGETEKAEAAFGPALGDFFLDTWEDFLKPFHHKVTEWLKITE